MEFSAIDNHDQSDRFEFSGWFGRTEHKDEYTVSVRGGYGGCYGCLSGAEGWLVEWVIDERAEPAEERTDYSCKDMGGQKALAMALDDFIYTLKEYGQEWFDGDEIPKTDVVNLKSLLVEH